ncbi:hypothetical protein Lalb_Chr15g0080231 [Lupinus albus]|uniref:Uncharacterized protein n=1 Tax=Lupinus albus TaxID=3870 RepID=A0A6A4PEA0_LUPAL|nr:hypothetical protein Lalb_Chr15g0080231 [Lupinus albus]
MSSNTFGRISSDASGACSSVIAHGCWHDDSIIWSSLVHESWHDDSVIWSSLFRLGASFG